jgi:hypothetical protein
MAQSVGLELLLVGVDDLAATVLALYGQVSIAIRLPNGMSCIL